MNVMTWRRAKTNEVEGKVFLGYFNGRAMGTIRQVALDKNEGYYIASAHWGTPWSGTKQTAKRAVTDYLLQR